MIKVIHGNRSPLNTPITPTIDDRRPLEPQLEAKITIHEPTKVWLQAEGDVFRRIVRGETCVEHIVITTHLNPADFEFVTTKNTALEGKIDYWNPWPKHLRKRPRAEVPEHLFVDGWEPKATFNHGLVKTPNVTTMEMLMDTNDAIRVLPGHDTHSKIMRFLVLGSCLFGNNLKSLWRTELNANDPNHLQLLEELLYKFRREFAGKTIHPTPCHKFIMDLL